jgi:hypothetical protein
MISCKNDGGNASTKPAAKAKYHYAVAMTGVVWGGCKSGVREAFSSLPGFVAIDFTKGDVPGQKKILLASDDESVNEQKLIDSLGKHAKQYVVKGVAKQ